MPAYELIHDDILKWAATYTGPKFHALLADAPYHLTEITKRFGGANSAPAKHGKDGAFARVSRGFMGSQWDGGDEIAFQPSTWQAIGEHLHGGAFLMVFAGTRGYHRMATAIEDAGFIIHPAIGWAFGSGFPKATRVDDQIDSAAGKIQSKIGERQHQPKFAAAEFEYREKDNGFNSKDRLTFDVLAPATDLASAWQGHRYGLQAIKPAFEFICVAQKPYEQVSCESIRAVTGWDHWCTTSELDSDARTRYAAKWGVALPDAGICYQIARKALHNGVQSDIEYWCDDVLLCTVNVKPFRAWATDNSVACMLVTRGAGAINIDGGRIGTDEIVNEQYEAYKGSAGIYNEYGSTLRHNGSGTSHELGRWPANLILSHHPECNGHCHEACPVRRLGEQSGESPSAGEYTESMGKPATEHKHYTSGAQASQRKNTYANETGTAARYFYNSDWMYERLEAADPVIYCAKASTAERDCGLDELPTITINDGRIADSDRPYLRNQLERKNPHPTVKAVSLTKHLASLLLPPDMYAGERRLLIPFAGVASEMIGALLAGWDHVTGIELEEKHVTVGNIRLAKWVQLAEQLRTSEPDVIVKELTRRGKPVVDTGQRSLFDLEDAA